MRADDKGTSPSVPLFGRTAVRLGFVTSKQLDKALKSQEEQRVKGGMKKIGQIMVEMGILKPEQVQMILLGQDKEVLSCPECHIQHNVRKSDLAKTLKEKPCANCGGRLIHRASRESLGAADREAVGDKTRPPGEAAAEGNVGEACNALIGQVVGNCRVEEKLGEGGMGVVFKGVHTLIRRTVALKVVSKAVGVSDERIRRFFLEAQSLGAIASPHIVQIYNVGEDKGFYFIEMEFVDGGSLEDLIVAKKCGLPLREARPVMTAVCAGLRDAHLKNVVHRDIKPANILISRNGDYKIADFGLAKSLEGGGEHTHDGAMMGTPHYMSPEQCRGLPADKRSDVYSLGAMFYLLLTGHRPFESDNPMVVILKHMNEEVRPPTRYVPALPRSYSNLVERMMAKDPKERFQDGGEVLAAIESIEKGGEVAYTARRIRRRQFRLAVSTALVILFGAGVFTGTRLYMNWLREHEAAIKTDAAETPEQRAAALVDEARSRFDGGDFAGAIVKAREALEASAGSGEAKALLSRVERLDVVRACLVSGDADRGLDKVQAYRKELGDDVQGRELQARLEMLRRAKTALRDGDWAGAERSASELLARDPKFQAAARARAVAAAARKAAFLESEGQRMEAVRELGRALGLDPGRTLPSADGVTRWRARLVEAIGEEISALAGRRSLDRARALALELAGAAPDAAGVEKCKADTLAAWAKYQELRRQGDDFLREGRFEAARTRYQEAAALQEDPALPAGIRAARYGSEVAGARAAEESGRLDEACAAYERAREWADDPAEIETRLLACRGRQAEECLRNADSWMEDGALDEASAEVGRARALWRGAEIPRSLLEREEELRRRREVPAGCVYVSRREVVLRPLGSAGPGGAPVAVGPVYVGIREVTNREFKEFVDAGGYARREWWDEEGWGMRASFLDRAGALPGPGTWSGGTFPSGQEDFPVLKVSWHEANAYARFRKSRLPTREEWMVAAGFSPREGGIRAFPWGNEWKADVANIMAGDREEKAARTGSFPNDLSPLGILDAAGNAAEWTSTPDPRAPGSFVVKGGSYRHSDPERVRISCDSRVPGPRRWAMLGFRLAADPGAVSPSGGNGNGRNPKGAK